ncbi:hypothetical protein [Leptospira sp. GIMC2001]|uniref:hypothetical protein n=1 Tax=Leptospira sp. GIMC2001 TaxID=1513297 RepID=UPI00234B9799|nr:hypothetical protein [Leptospira sp. GIMC2001]WCL48207.1 hypothetical protein O4O04_12920 [Leptospira sp. GIMC2001]
MDNLKSLLLKHRFVFIIYFILSFLIISKIIGAFSGVIFGYADTVHWSYNAYYFSKYLSFNGLYFDVDLNNNESFFPFGTVQAFQSWGLEKDFFNYLIYTWIGHSGFLKIYAFLSISFSFWGIYFLLQKHFSLTQSMVPALAGSFLGYYSILKYPYHYGFTIHHWTGLSLVLDFLIIYKLIVDQEININYFLLRIAFLFFSFGEDLTYVTSIGVLSILIHGLVIVSYSIFNTKKINIFLKPKWLVVSIFLFSLLVFTTYYLPIFMKIYFSIMDFSKEGFLQAFWWSNPIRLLIPIIPKLNILDLKYHLMIGDSSDSIGVFTLSSLILFSLFYCLFHINRRLFAILPLLLLACILLSYHPSEFPYLTKLPWFNYFRVSGRSSFAISIIFGMFGAFVHFENFFLTKWKKVLVIAFLIFLIWEVRTVYSHKNNTEIKLSNDNLEYFNSIKNLPGEAILDWPFCIFGADGDERLCPYFSNTGNQYSLRQFHHKKSIGQYFGRMHQTQKDIFLSKGWDKLFLMDSQSDPFFPKQSRCWNDQEWNQFLSFYNSYDFAGINLYSDILDDKCKEVFKKRFGEPIDKTNLHLSGELWLFRKK